MVSSLFSYPHLIGVASEFWMTRWLTSFWLTGLGVLLGMVILAVFALLFLGLSRIPLLEKLQRNGTAFWVGLVGSAILTALAAWGVRSSFDSRTGFRSDEWLLLSVALWPLMAVTLWAILFGGQRRFMSELRESLTRGVGAYIVNVLLAIAAIGVLCTFLVDEPRSLVTSIPALFQSGESNQTFTVAGQEIDASESSSKFTPLPLRYQPSSLFRIRIQSDRNVLLADAEDASAFSSKPVRVDAREEIDWNRQMSTPPPIPLVVGGKLFAQNLEIDPAQITITLTSIPPYPEAVAIFAIASVVTWIGLAWMLQLAAGPKLSAIALSAAKSELSQPMPMILILIGSFLIFGFIYLPFHTEGEDIKLLKDCGLTLILVICLFQGVWSASTSVSEEIEGRTALTLLSKPIHRRSFILGKMLGIFWVLFLLVLVLGFFLMLAVAYKPLYDARENTADTPLWQMCHLEAMRILPGLFMVLLQASTLSAISVALATRVPQLANFTICFSLYLIGHLTPSIVSSSADAFPIIQFVAQLIAVIVPTLDWYSMDKAIDTGNPIPMVYLAGVFVYSLLYTAFAIFLGLLLFEDRDLA